MVSPQEHEFRAKLKELRDHLTKNAENVGGKFPEEARKMHYGEIEHRSIYGEASPQDAKELADEGIDSTRCRCCRTTETDAASVGAHCTQINSTTPDHDQRNAERVASRRCLLENEERDRLREQHLDQPERAHVGDAGSAKARNQNSDAVAPMKPANSDGRHRPQMARSTARSRTAR